MFRTFVVSYDTYNQYLKENKNSRLTKFDKISYQKGKPIFEIFDTEINDLEFDLKITKSINFGNLFNYRYLFNSKNNNKYVLDIIPMLEDNSKLKNTILHNKILLSISFSLADTGDDDYDDSTYLNEQFDILNRVKFLVDDFIKKYYNYKKEIFMFGKPEDRRYNTYKYIISKCFKDYKLIKDYTSYFESKIGFYLIKN